MSLRFDIWKPFVTGYTSQTNLPIDAAGKKLMENNAKSMNVILCGLLESKFIKVIYFKSIKKNGTSFKIFMNTMIRSRKPNSKLIENNFRA